MISASINRNHVHVQAEAPSRNHKDSDVNAGAFVVQMNSDVQQKSSMLCKSLCMQLQQDRIVLLHVRQHRYLLVIHDGFDLVAFCQGHLLEQGHQLGVPVENHSMALSHHCKVSHSPLETRIKQPAAQHFDAVCLSLCYHMLSQHMLMLTQKQALHTHMH